MHLPQTRHSTKVLLTSALLLPAGLQAASLYWDTNGATAGAGTTADGTWDAGSTANWTTDSTGASATTSFTNTDDAIFSAGADVTAASITASGTPSANSVTVEEGTYNFSGNISLGNVGNTGSFTVASGASVSMAGNITLLGNIAFGISGSMSANINGAGKTFTKSGVGTLTLNDAVSSDYSVVVDAGLVVLQRSTTKQLKASTVNSGGTLRLAASDQLGSNLTVNGGGTLELSNGVSDNIASLGGSGDIDAGTGTSLGVTGGTFSGTISGDLDIVKTNTGTHTFSGTSTSTGDITVSGGTYTLSSTGSLTFTIGADGVNNAILGAGTDTATNLNGTFNFDLSGADLTDGNSWLIVDVANLTESFAGTFAITGFTEDANVWTNGTGFTFTEATGTLTYGAAIPEPSTFGLLAGLGALGAFGLRRRRAA